jgi:hypothetical protein
LFLKPVMQAPGEGHISMVMTDETGKELDRGVGAETMNRDKIPGGD